MARRRVRIPRMSKKTIMIVEDERDMAELIAMRLKRERYAVEVAHDGQSALKMIRGRVPDALVLDIMMPGMSGLDLLKELRGDPRTASLPVLLLTAKSEEADIVVGLHLGADDYVTKPFSMAVLLARVAAILRRRADAVADSTQVITAGLLEIDTQKHEVKVAGEDVPLTRTEFRLLLALAAGRGKVLTRNQLIDQTIGMDAVVTDRTIDVHLTALRRKLGASRDCIRTVRGVGYSLSFDENA